MTLSDDDGGPTMTTRTDRIRQHLERHGYRIWCDEGGCAFECHGDELAGVAANDYANDPASLQDACNAALAHFLADASKTGARMTDLCHNAVNSSISWRQGVDAICGNRAAHGKDPDEAIAYLWERVFIDSEDNQ